MKVLDLDDEMLDKFASVDTDPYDGFLHRTFEQAEVIAKSKGCVVRAPGPRELFIDLDSHEAIKAFEKLKGACPKGMIVKSTMTPSPSGEPGHYHVVVTINRDLRDERERILLQAVLGSDPMRELLSWRRLEDGSEPRAVSLFFEKEASMLIRLAPKVTHEA